MQTLQYHVPGISCGHCVNTLKTELGEVDGVQQVDVILETKIVHIRFEPPASPELIESTLVGISYPPELVNSSA